MLALVSSPAPLIAGAPVLERRGRRALLLPVEWSSQAVAHGQYTIASFYDSFLAGLTAGETLAYEDVLTWWRVAAQADVADVSELSATHTDLSNANRVVLTNWVNALAKSRFDLFVPPGFAPVDALTNASFLGGMATLTTEVNTSRNDAAARETVRNAPQTFAGRYTNSIRDEMFNILNIVNETGLPPLLLALARNKKQASDIPAIRTAIDSRADEANCLASEYSRPKATTALVTMLRDFRLTNVGDELTSGLSPFTMQCSGHTGAKHATKVLDSQLLLEQTSTSLSYADTEMFAVKEASLPKDEMLASDMLEAHSLVVDLVMGINHAFSIGYRNLLVGLISFMTKGLRNHHPYNPGKRLHIALRIMYYITQSTFYYIHERRIGHDPPLPDWAELTKATKVLNFERILPDLPEAWLARVDALIAPAPSPSPGPGPTPAEAGAAGGAAGTRVRNENGNDALQRRFAASGFTKIRDMIKAGKEASGPDPEMPTIGSSDACLTWLLRKHCWSNCNHAETHKFAPAATARKAHLMMDACGVPALE